MAIPKIRANLEQPRVAWLSSPKYTTSESFSTLQEQIKDIVEHFYRCKNVNDCEYFIRGKHGHPQYEQIFLIVTTDNIYPILQQDIHDVRVLQAIFIFHPNTDEFSSTFKEYSKVEGIYSSPSELLMQLSTSVDNFSKESGILISTLKGCDVEMTTNIINNFADFSELWFPLFIDLLFDLPTPSDNIRAQEIKQFANQCQRFYAHNERMLAQIEEFLSSPNGYSSNVAVKYYTRDFFLFRRINKALRQQNFQAILDFRFFLIDMQAQLQTAYPLFSCLYDIGDMMTFYRGQRMAKQERDLLQEKRRTGSLITVNSYLSASISRDIAMSFIRECPNGELIPVILEIKAEFKDPTVIRRKPFAYIGNLSHCHSDELEVLFSVGSFFRVDEIKFDENDNLNVIQLTFIYDEEHCTITDDYGTLKTCSLEEKIFKTGDLLYKNAKHGAIKANAFYQHFLSDTYSSLIKAACHTGLGWLAFKQKQFDLAIQCQEQAIKMYQSFNDNDCSKYLYVTSYNCIGAVYKQQEQYTKALPYYIKAHGLGSNIIPIDKYAFYNTFNNIASINIACIYKIQGSIDRAWSTYKKMLASQMMTSTRFHGATYLKIAEADFSEGGKLLDNNNEQMNHWKYFLDYSLTDMSSTYRRSIVSGVLSIGLRFANNEQNWNQAINYYKKIIEISHKYVTISTEDYNIVVQCHQQIAELYRKKRNYIMSIKYASDGLPLCRINDLEFYTVFYESMTKTYEEQLQQLNSNLSPEDIDFQIAPDLPSSTSLAYIRRTTSTDQTIVLHFERDEFSFGQYKKSLNSNLLKEPNLKRCLIYCLLKLTALRNEQGKTDNISELLYRVSTLVPDDKRIQFICKNNRTYLEGKFKEIINEYETSLKEYRNDNKKLCVNEDAYCYIAHLYGRDNDTNAEQQWYRKAITYFEEYKFVCQHTRSCFVKMALFYQTKNDLSSCISTYLKLVHHLLEYRNETFQLQREVVVIVESILQQLNPDDKDQIDMLKRLVQLVLRQSEDINLLDSDFQWIIDRYRKNRKQSWLATHAYEAYLNHILQHITRPLSSYVQTITPPFLQVTTVYKLRDDPSGAFDVYQRLVNIILRYSTDRDRIISTFKQIALDLEQKRQTKAILNIYEALRQFIYAYPGAIIYQDDDLISYILDRLQVLIERNNEAAASIYRIMIRIVRSYQEEHNPDLDSKLYFKWMEKYYMELPLVEPLSALDCYSNLLDIFLNLRSEEFDKMLIKIVNAMRDRPRELLEILTKYRFDYKELIQHAHRQLLHPTDQSIMSEPFPQTRSSFFNNILSSYAKKAKRCYNISKGLNSIIECWTKCLYFLLEVCSENDAYFAACYMQLADPIRAANVFDPFVYNNLAIQYCPNACRRYLKYVYPQTQIRDELELYFADHFYCINGKKEIRSLEPVNY